MNQILPVSCSEPWPVSAQMSDPAREVDRGEEGLEPLNSEAKGTALIGLGRPQLISGIGATEESGFPVGLEWVYVGLGAPPP